MEADPRTPAPDELVERALVRIRRRQRRRVFGEEAAASHGLDALVVEVLDAVDEGASAGGEPVTVGLVARRLGVDQSRASRLVARAVDLGHVRRGASQADGRVSVLEVTTLGEALLQDVRRSRRERFAAAMRDWSPEERRAFAHLLDRFTTALEQPPRTVSRRARPT